MLYMHIYIILYMHIYLYVHCSEWARGKRGKQKKLNFLFILHVSGLISAQPRYLFSPKIRQKQGRNKKHKEDWPPSNKSILNDRRSDGSNFTDFTRNGCCVCCYSNRSFVTKKLRENMENLKVFVLRKRRPKNDRICSPKCPCSFSTCLPSPYT